jgi:hypothetical protein
MSVVLCSQSPCYPITKVWTRSEMANAWKVFKASCAIWQLTNKFNPAVNAKMIHNNG